MEMCYDGALVMPNNYAIVDEEEMTYVDGGASIKPRWYGFDIYLSSDECEGLAWALTTGAGGAWLAAELHAPTIIGGIAWGVIAASLALAAGATGLINWASNGRGIIYHHEVFYNSGWITPQ